MEAREYSAAMYSRDFLKGMEPLQSGHGGLEIGRSQGRRRPHDWLLRGKLKDSCRFKVKGSQELEEAGG